MDRHWSDEGSTWVNTLSTDQKNALKEFFVGTPDETFQRLKLRKIPPGLRKETLQGYVLHVIEPAIRTKRDKATYSLNGEQSVGMQAFRKQLILDALPLIAPFQKKRRFRIRTVAGGGLAAFVGGSVTTFEVEDMEVKESVYYTLSGVDFGFGFKAGGGQGPSSWTEFSSERDLKDFHGYVTFLSASAAVGLGGGAFNMSFVNRPAAGLTIPGIGWSTGLGASLTGTHGWMKLRD